jgi:hypothetical protein
VIVDRGVDVVVAGGAAAIGAGGTTVDAPPSAVGDAAELFDVDVDELAGPASFVAADDLARGPVEEGQAVQAVPGQDPVDGRGGQAQDRADAGRAQLALWAVGREMPVPAATCATGRPERTRSMSSRRP